MLALIILAGNLVGAALAVAWILVTRTDWERVGFTASRHRAVSLAAATLGGVALKLVLKTVVMPLLHAPPTNAAYRFMVGNAAALPGMIAFVIVGGGFGEELVWRALPFDRVRQAFGWTSGVRIVTVVLTAALFAAAHLHEQGLAGAEEALVTGLVFGGVYARTGRIWPIMVAHASFDVAALLIIYHDLERPLSHAFFR